MTLFSQLSVAHHKLKERSPPALSHDNKTEAVPRQSAKRQWQRLYRRDRWHQMTQQFAVTPISNMITWHGSSVHRLNDSSNGNDKTAQQWACIGAYGQTVLRVKAVSRWKQQYSEWFPLLAYLMHTFSSPLVPSCSPFRSISFTGG